MNFEKKPEEQPEAVTHGEEPEVLKMLQRIFTQTGDTTRIGLTCVAEHGCHSTQQPHNITEGTLNGEPGWLECECLTCGDTNVWHRASNFHTSRYTHGVVLRFQKRVQ